MAQSLQPDELVISDDGSSEDIISGVQDLLHEAVFKVVFVKQDDKGFRAARCRNNGVRQTTGDFIVCFDPDLIFSKQYLRTLTDAAKKQTFVVGQVIRFTEMQNHQIKREYIQTGNFSSILTKSQAQLISKQYRKELLYKWLHALKLRKIGPKLRSGLVGFFKEDFIRVNGFDEKFVGWGNEDDDLGTRLYASGIRGLNPFKTDYAIHLFHEKFHNDERVNKKYQKQRMNEINRKNFRCEYGYDIYDDQKEVAITVIKE